MALDPGTLTPMGVAVACRPMTFVLFPMLGLTLTANPVAAVVGGIIGLMPPRLDPATLGIAFFVVSYSFLIAIGLLWPILPLLAMLIFGAPLLLDLSFFGEGIDLR